MAGCIWRMIPGPNLRVMVPPQAADAMDGASANQRMARPDAVLFNGGFCAPAVTRDRIVEAISAWLGGTQTSWSPRLLNNDEVDSAVARGAAYYGRVRRGTDLRIRAGNARTYYIGLRSDRGLQGICVLPAGVDTVAVVKHEPTGLRIHYNFSKLLQGPGCCGVGGDVAVSDPAGSDFQENEHVKNSKGSGHHDEEVASHNGLGMISYEGHPSSVERHVASDRPRRDANV